MRCRVVSYATGQPLTPPPPHTDVSFVFDNEAIYKICSKNLGVESPTYVNLNRMIAQCTASITCSMRFPGALNVDLGEFHTNLVPYPRIHYITSALVPITSNAKAARDTATVAELTKKCFMPASMMNSCDPRHGKYMSAMTCYRGDVTPNDVNKVRSSAAVPWSWLCVRRSMHRRAPTPVTPRPNPPQAVFGVREMRTVQFVDWAPTGIKVGMNYQSATAVPGDIMAPSPRTLCMVGNNTGIAEVSPTGRRGAAHSPALIRPPSLFRSILVSTTSSTSCTPNDPLSTGS